MTLKAASGSIETRQADMMHGTSVFHEQMSRNSLEALFRALRLSKTLQPVKRRPLNEVQLSNMIEDFTSHFAVAYATNSAND